MHFTTRQLNSRVRCPTNGGFYCFQFVIVYLPPPLRDARGLVWSYKLTTPWSVTLTSSGKLCKRWCPTFRIHNACLFPGLYDLVGNAQVGVGRRALCLLGSGIAVKQAWRLPAAQWVETQIQLEKINNSFPIKDIFTKICTGVTRNIYVHYTKSEYFNSRRTTPVQGQFYIRHILSYNINFYENLYRSLK